MSEKSGGSGPPNVDPFNVYNLLHRGEMPTLESSTKKNFKALKTAFFTHPSDAEKYFVIGGDAIRKMDVFDINEGLEMISKQDFLSTTILKSGDVLVKTRNLQQVDQLKSTKKFGSNEVDVSISENGALNQSQAIIRVREIMKVEVEKIAKNLKQYNVIQVQRLKRREGDAWVDTPTHVLTFSTPIIPAEIKVGFIHVKTEIFIPAPFRCGICQKLGHTKKRCNSKRNRPTCVNCAGAYHHYGPCLPTCCVNCRGSHPSSSKLCPKYLEEREINAIRVTLRIPYKLAREELILRRGKPTSNPINPVPSSSRSNESATHMKPKSYAEAVESSAEPIDIDTENHAKDIDGRMFVTNNRERKSREGQKPKVTKKEFKRNIHTATVNNLKKVFSTNPNYTLRNSSSIQHKENSTKQLATSEQSKIQPVKSDHYVADPFMGFSSSSKSSPSSSFIPSPISITPPPPEEDAEPPDIDISDASSDSETTGYM